MYCNYEQTNNKKKKGGGSGVIDIFEYLRRGMLNVNYGLDFNPLWIQDGEDLSGFNVGPVDQMYFMTCKKKFTTRKSSTQNPGDSSCNLGSRDRRLGVFYE